MKKIIFSAWLLLNVLLYPTTINVPSGQPTIQAGINVSDDGDTILVSPGTYVENIDFNGKNIVVGSFFLISGDTSLISQTIIDGNELSSVVMFEKGETSESKLIGFSIINGKGKDLAPPGAWPYDYIGGGVTCRNNSNPSLIHLKIYGNTAPFGGGICIRESKPELNHVIIYMNRAEHTGGGIYCYYYSSPIFKNTVIAHNTAVFWGGGASCLIGSSPTFSNVLITQNLSNEGGGIYSFDQSEPKLEKTVVSRNTAFVRGGGIYGDISSLTFNSDNRSNIYCNYGGIGSDICIEGSFQTINVVVDTFTVLNPTDYHAYPLNKFTFDILHAKIDPVDHDLYVSPEGNDLNTGISPNEPLRTISSAVSKITTSFSPHTIYIANGAYKTSSGEHFPINMKDHLSLSGDSEDEVILDAEGNGNVIYFNSVVGNKIEDISLTGGNAYSGGAINCINSSPILRNLRIYNNTAVNYGGGIYCMESSPILNDVKIFENKSSWGGGGIFCIYNSSPVLENVTISRNTTKYWAGAVYSESESNPHLINTILWNNYPHEIRLLRGDVTVEYSDVRGGKNEIVNDTTNWLNEGTIYWMEGNIDANPLFCNPVIGKYTLAENSPCKGTGKSGVDIGAQEVGCDSIFIDETLSIFYVSVNGSDENGTGAYDNPFATIQHAFNLADTGDTILVYPGIYYENLNLNKSEFVLGSLFMTTADTSYIYSTIINGDSSGSAVFITSGDSTSTFIGFTITNGKADEGGGIFCINSNLTLSNLMIIGNTAGSGGGIAVHDSRCNIINSIITNNKSLVSGGGLSSLSSNPILSNVIIRGNISDGSGGGCSFYSSVPHLKRVTLTDNIAYYNGGGISLNFSSAIFDSAERCNIYMNYAGRGSEIDFFNFDEGNSDINVFADTFTVKNPTDYHAYRIDRFDILHGILSQSSRDLFVNPIGDNDNSGETFSEPLLSISFALSKIKADSINPRTIYLADGKYSPSETGEHFPLNMAYYISLKGEDSSSVILDAEGISGVLSFDTDQYNFVENLSITNGFRFEGGGIYCANSSPNFMKVVISDNKAIRRGGAMYCSDYSNPHLENCTITNNEADLGGGIALSRSCVNLLNTILWNNSPDEIYFDSKDSRNCVEIAYTDIKDSTNRITTNNNGDIYWLGGNLNSDPLFCNAEDNDYFLAENSPCVGSSANGKNIGALPIGCGTVRLENVQNDLPSVFGLFQNYPNPFNPSTIIRYEIPIESEVLIKVYDIMGREVATLVNDYQKAGRYQVEWNAGNFASGVYFFSITAGDFQSIKKLMLLK